MKWMCLLIYIYFPMVTLCYISRFRLLNDIWMPFAKFSVNFLSWTIFFNFKSFNWWVCCVHGNGVNFICRILFKNTYLTQEEQWNYITDIKLQVSPTWCYLCLKTLAHLEVYQVQKNRGNFSGGIEKGTRPTQRILHWIKIGLLPTLNHSSRKWFTHR